MRFAAFLFPAILAAQTTSMLNLYPANPAAEQNDLNQAVTDANGSTIDLTRALEQHLRKYPNSARRADIVAALYKNAVEALDYPRIALYGESLLLGHPDNELDILDHVVRAILTSGDSESSKKALLFGKRYEEAVGAFRAKPTEGHATAAQWADFADRALARALVLEGRATGNLGNIDDAIAFARRAWAAQPTAESAHEMARWLAKKGSDAEAIEHYADAAEVDDPRSPWADRDRDRKLASALYVKLHGSEAGFGDVLLQAWNRDAQALLDRSARYRTIDRNYEVTDLLAFVLPPASATDQPLDMSTLKSKTVVVDFWATWCVPCLAQHPLIEHVKQKYAQSSDVVFLSLDADDDHSLVTPFLTAQKWPQRVYLEDGLAEFLTVSSLPTVLIIDPSGKVYSRMIGYKADVFEDTLSTRIDGARAAAAK